MARTLFPSRFATNDRVYMPFTRETSMFNVTDVAADGTLSLTRDDGTTRVAHPEDDRIIKVGE
jgi:hypothetical protein